MSITDGKPTKRPNDAVNGQDNDKKVRARNPRGQVIYTILGGFSNARKRFATERDTADGIVAFTAAFCRKTLDHLASAEEDDRFQDQTQLLLMFVLKGIDRDRELEALKAVPSSTYLEIAKRIGQTSTGLARLRSQIAGRYRYFRYHSVKGTTLKPAVVEGALMIFEPHDGTVQFEHRSEDWGVDASEPEHTGWVFFRNGKIFMLGTRDRALRLAIIQLGEEDDPLTKLLDGLVLSVRNKNDSSAFAARSIVIHEDNPELAEFRQKPSDPEVPHHFFVHCQREEAWLLSL